MSGHVVFRDMRPEDVKVITFGEPGSLIDRVDRPDVVARVALYENRIVGYAVSWLAVVHRTVDLSTLRSILTLGAIGSVRGWCVRSSRG